MGSDQRISEREDSDAGLRAAVDRLKRTAQALDAALDDARRVGMTKPWAPSANRAA